MGSLSPCDIAFIYLFPSNTCRQQPSPSLIKLQFILFLNPEQACMATGSPVFNTQQGRKGERCEAEEIWHGSRTLNQISFSVSILFQGKSLLLHITSFLNTNQIGITGKLQREHETR